MRTLVKKVGGIIELDASLEPIANAEAGGADAEYKEYPGEHGLVEPFCRWSS
jgi:hypothetical protein